MFLNKWSKKKRMQCFFFAAFLLIICVGTCIVKGRVFRQVSGNVSKRELPIYCVDTNKKQLAITFDAAWGVEDLKTIRAILKKYKVPAVFFVTGEWAEKFPEYIRQLLKDGHDIGSHGDHHKYMTQLNEEEIKKEITGVCEKVKKIAGYEIHLFRPPYGDYNDTVIKVSREAGYEAVQWSVDSLDWKNYGTDSIIKTVTEHKNLENGAIILLHNGTKYTKDALEPMLKLLIKKGYSFVAAKDLIYPPPYEIDTAGKQIRIKGSEAMEILK